MTGPEESGSGSASSGIEDADEFDRGNKKKNGYHMNKTKAGSGGAADRNLLYLELSHVNFECFQALVDYAYTSRLEIPCGQVADLYKTSCMLRVPECAKVCANYLADNLSPKNCIGVRRCANKTNDSLLASCVDSYIQENFNNIVHESQEFTSLPCIQVEVIQKIKDKQGLCDQKTEEKSSSFIGLAEKVLEWLQNREIPEHMEFRMEQLTEKVHLLYVKDNLMLQDCTEMDNSSSLWFSDLVQDYKRCYAQKKSSRKKSSSSSSGSSKVVQVSPSSQKTGSDMAGHHTYKALSRISSTDSMNSSSSMIEADEIESKLIALTKLSDCYCITLAVLRRKLVAVSIQLIDDTELQGSEADLVTKSTTTIISAWTNNTEDSRTSEEVFRTFGRVYIPTMTSPRCSVGAVNLNGKLVVCGGYDRGECMGLVEEYDPMVNEWRNLNPMLEERGRFDATLCQGRVYACGGSDGNRDLASAECFNPTTGHWTQLPEMSLARSNNGCATLGDQVYCIGGWNGQTGIKLCERFDPVSNRWEMVPPLLVGRSQASCTSWMGGIVAVGGCDGWSSTNSVEFFDPRTNSWRHLSNMNTARRGCGISVLKGKLYVAGGSDGVNCLNSVEIFDTTEGTWSQGPPMTCPRANVHLVTIGEAIYAVGGFNGKTFLNSIELLEAGSNSWRGWMAVNARSRQNSRCWSAGPKEKEKEMQQEVHTDESGVEDCLA